MLCVGSLNLKDIVDAQKDLWFVIPLFPMFVIVKLFNKYFIKKVKVKNQQKMTNSIITKLLLKIEMFLFNRALIPFGVRCFMVVKKK